MHLESHLGKGSQDEEGGEGEVRAYEGARGAREQRKLVLVRLQPAELDAVAGRGGRAVCVGGGGGGRAEQGAIMQAARAGRRGRRGR